MKAKHLLITILCTMAVPLAGSAQEEQPVYAPTTTENDAQARVGFDISKRLAKGLHITWGEELRLKNTFTTVDRVQSSLGVTYRVNKWFRVGAAYTFISTWHDGKKSTNYEKYWDLRHRGHADLLFTQRVGKWRFSFRERPQFTFRTDSINTREKSRVDITLRHRFKVDYEVHHLPIRPYVSVEVSNTLNAPEIGGNYIEKVRSMLGVTWELSKRSTMEFYYRFDYTFGKDIHITKNKGKITVTPEKGYYHILGVFYEYSF